MCCAFTRILLRSALLATVSASASSSNEIDEASAQQTSTSIAESADGLQSQLETIIAAATGDDSKHYGDLVSQLKVPDAPDWFSAAFGEEAGPKVAASYANSWGAYQDQITRIFQEVGKTHPKRVFVKESSANSPSVSDPFLQAVLKGVKSRAVLYTAAAGKEREITTLPGVYVYAQGAFRIVNWGAFYALPNVKSPRIRVGTTVAMSQIIHQVNPTMSAEVREQQLQGTVVLHIVIDRDGNVSQVQPVSGPDLLIHDATEAVRQWRFRLTFLNGDPVEVDTTVNINFSR